MIRSIWSNPCQPGWIVAYVGSSHLTPMASWATRNGATDAWYPTDTKYVHEKRPPGDGLQCGSP